MPGLRRDPFVWESVALDNDDQGTTATPSSSRCQKHGTFYLCGFFRTGCIVMSDD